MRHWLDDHLDCVEVLLVLRVKHLDNSLAHLFRKEHACAFDMCNVFVFGEPLKEAGPSCGFHLPLVSLQRLPCQVHVLVLRKQDEICGMHDPHLLSDLHFFLRRDLLLVHLVLHLDLAPDLVQEGKHRSLFLERSRFLCPDDELGLDLVAL